MRFDEFRQYFDDTALIQGLIRRIAFGYSLWQHQVRSLLVKNIVKNKDENAIDPFDNYIISLAWAREPRFYELWANHRSS